MAKKKSTSPKRVLVVVTSTAEYDQAGYRTGLWLGELTHFYDVVTEAGHEVVIASVTGGRVPLDPVSLGALVLKQGGTDDRYEDRAFMDLLAETPSLSEVADQKFDAIYLAGGHGTMFDFPDNADLARIIERTDAEGGVVSAVCHGPAGFIGVGRADGAPFLKGRKVTGFSWAEEKLAGRAKVVPFRLHQRLKEEGASYSKAIRPMASKVVVDGRLVTGQNPSSAADVAEKVVALLGKR
ncbi:type 1 glutamine amidotransferase domain-containing protein [Ammonicoccus fulvus]|uniref:Type 1 glutamine amidotransferase domain-containing protein n=1 Tax=Ammonicoccus fulvus TaxID=3138240 RepID=A0ABZ3FV77_9ACTN